MMPRVLRSSAGFTYITVMVLVVVTGIMAARGALVWKTAMQREKEQELISRGIEIRDAMRRWYKFTRGQDGKWAEPTKPEERAPNIPELKSLEKDPRSARTVRYLRSHALIDPITGKDWDVIRENGKIVGVKSTSEKEPIKQANFPLELHPQDFEKKKKYSEWEFRYNRVYELPKTGQNNPGASQ